MTQKPGGKGAEIKRALTDFVVLCVLLTATSFSGYYWGLHQQLAPIEKVPAGTAGAILPPPISHGAAGAESTANASVAKTAASVNSPASDTTSGATSSGKHKYWIASSGSDYVGYNITVAINGTPVDSFYGPGKTVNITNLVKSGDNTVTFEAKALGADYNKHAGDGSSALNVQIVGGPVVQENFKASDVLASYKRNATDSGDASDTLHFTGE